MIIASASSYSGAFALSRFGGTLFTFKILAFNFVNGIEYLLEVHIKNDSLPVSCFKFFNQSCKG